MRLGAPPAYARASGSFSKGRPGSPSRPCEGSHPSGRPRLECFGMFSMMASSDQADRHAISFRLMAIATRTGRTGPTSSTSDDVSRSATTGRAAARGD
jgi:hypothetical protein